MRIGLFTDTYFPQVSGVATSIRTLREVLMARGHQVYIFTTTDPQADPVLDRQEQIYRFPSIPFVSFPERRITVSGWMKVLLIAKRLQLDVIHTQTEFSLGVMGHLVARELKIPCLHTYHTMYEDYLHYVANGRLIKPQNVATILRTFLKHVDGVVAPSDRVLTTLRKYGIEAPIQVIPTGINLQRFQAPVDPQTLLTLREQYGYDEQTPVMLSLSRLAFEKNIKGLIDAMPEIIQAVPQAQLLIVGDGPAKASLMRQVKVMGLQAHVQFAGEIKNQFVHRYYQMANVFVSASDSETQGLTYDEAVASDLPIVVMRSEYTDELIDDLAIGVSYQKKADLVAGVTNYLKHGTNPEATKLRQAKMHAISAEVFGQRIEAYYQTCIEQRQGRQPKPRRWRLKVKWHD